MYISIGSRKPIFLNTYWKHPLGTRVLNILGLHIYICVYIYVYKYWKHPLGTDVFGHLLETPLDTYWETIREPTSIFVFYTKSNIHSAYLYIAFYPHRSCFGSLV